jgi:hypothetical protein
MFYAGAKIYLPRMVVNSAEHSAVYKLSTFITELTLQDIIVR